jgi:exopolyphosphatase/pppGpp-phosphohydrolase
MEVSDSVEHRIGVEFPSRTACVDMGSNAARFLVAEFTRLFGKEVWWRFVEERLGRGVAS